MNRSDFIKKSSKFLALGTLTHFSLLGNNASSSSDGAGNGGRCSPVADDCYTGAPGGNEDRCPGGLPNSDVCIGSSGNGSKADECPGEAPPADKCISGDRRSGVDICNVEVASADECREVIPGADQCESGRHPDDLCSKNLYPNDQCPSGGNPDDACPPNGNDTAHGDSCPGGGNTVDNCQTPPGGNAGGDECGTGSWGAGGDDCHNTTPTDQDICSANIMTFSDDACPAGTNAGSGQNGALDWCSPALGGKLASDTCIDGTDEQDLCVSKGKDGMNDVCPGGANTVDRCDEVSDDYCLGGKGDSDICSEHSKDECPGGGAECDTCPIPPTQWDNDECTALEGCAGGDQSTGMDKDACTALSNDDKCNAGTPDASVE